MKLAEVGSNPVAAYQRALDVARSLMDSGRLAPVDHWMVAELERRLAAARGK
ncbi:MAG: hypothetical protein U5K75_01040 [Ahrensia sp.]|nr:hypothetical protein [Ahrensia sp.]